MQFRIVFRYFLLICLIPWLFSINPALGYMYPEPISRQSGRQPVWQTAGVSEKSQFLILDCRTSWREGPRTGECGADSGGEIWGNVGGFAPSNTSPRIFLRLPSPEFLPATGVTFFQMIKIRPDWNICQDYSGSTALDFGSTQKLRFRAIA